MPAWGHCGILLIICGFRVASRPGFRCPFRFWRAALFVYLYYLLAAALENKAQKLCVRYLTGVGKNSLFYLLLSNLIIFAVTASKFYRKEINYSIGLFLVILSVIWYLQGICKGRDS